MGAFRRSFCPSISDAIDLLLPLSSSLRSIASTRKGWMLQATSSRVRRGGRLEWNSLFRFFFFSSSNRERERKKNVFFFFFFDHCFFPFFIAITSINVSLLFFSQTKKRQKMPFTLEEPPYALVSGLFLASRAVFAGFERGGLLKKKATRGRMRFDRRRWVGDDDVVCLCSHAHCVLYFFLFFIFFANTFNRTRSSPRSPRYDFCF